MFLYIISCISFSGWAGSSLWRMGISLRSKRGLLYVAVCGILTAVVSLVVDHRLSGIWASVVVAQ